MRNPVVFFVVLSVIILLIDLYAFRGIKLLVTNFSKNGKTAIYISYWLLFIGLMVLSFVSATNFMASKVQSNYKTSFYIMAIFVLYLVPKLIFIVFLLLEDLGYLGIWGVKKVVLSAGEGAEVINRKTFLTQVGLGLATLQGAALVYGIAKGRYNYKVHEHTVSFPNLPDAFDGMRIVQLSDIHIGSFFDNHEKVKKGFEMVNKLNPDYILFTGDMVNNLATELDGWADVFKSLKAKHGKFSVLGNHDYGDYVQWDSDDIKRKNLEQLVKTQEELGFKVLKNETVTLERNGSTVKLLGMENWGKGGFSKYGDLKKTMQNVSDNDFKILLSHDPSHWDEEVIGKTNIDIALAGHTHGMQFGVEVAGIKWSPSKYRYPRWGGLYQENNQYLHVNRGFGYLGFPGRVGIYPEITLIEFRKKV